MIPLRSDELLSLPLRLHGIELGRPVDLLVDRGDLRLLGFDVLCRDDVHRFLPLPTALVADDGIVISSPFVLLEEDELAFYKSRAAALASLRAAPVTRAGLPVGTLNEVAFDADGAPTELIVEDGGRDAPVPFDESVRIETGSRSAA